MDYKQFRRRLSGLMARPVEDIDALVEGLAVVLRDSCAELDSVAIPTFGTFVPVKHKEEIVSDLSTGRKMLLPPEIKIDFQPGGLLQKRLRNE